MDIGYTVDPRIVRGLDYYTKTVFEIITDTENGPLTVCGGGRYDGLVEELGGPATPGIGFGMGVERMMMVQDARGCAPKAPALYDAFVCTLGDQARYEAARLVRELREAGIKADMDHAARSLKAQFKYADKVGVSRVLVLAEDELEPRRGQAARHGRERRGGSPARPDRRQAAAPSGLNAERKLIAASDSCLRRFFALLRLDACGMRQQAYRSSADKLRWGSGGARSECGASPSGAERVPALIEFLHRKELF